MITIYRAKEDNFATLGLGALNPIDVTVTWEEGGRYDLTLKQPITEDGKWMMIGDECIIRGPSPVRESPYVEQSLGDTQIELISREIYRVDTPNGGRLRLRQSATTSSKILSSHKPGTEVVRTGTQGEWSKVIVIDGGSTGWMYSDYLKYIRTESEAAPNGDKPGTVVKRRQAGDQLYRITDYGTDSANGVIVVNADHISYDLGRVKVIGKCEITNMPVRDALRKVQSMLSREHDFEIHCMVEGYVSGDYTNKSLLECIRDPKAGFAPQLKARVVCDNFDVWILPDEVRDMGVVLKYRKNLLGVKMKVDTTQRVSRIYPVGQDEDGEPLYLENQGYVESKSAGDFVGRDDVVEYGVKVGDGEGEYADANEARKELARRAEEDMQSGADGKLVSLDVSFLDLGDTEEYKQYKGLLVVHPYDTVTIVRGEFGIREKARLSKCVMDGLTKKYKSTTFGALQSTSLAIHSFDIVNGAVGGAQIAHGAVGTAALRNLSIQFAKIAKAAIKQLNAEAITAITAHINEVVAGSITTDELYAAIAKIMALEVGSITADNIETDALAAVLGEFVKVYTEYAGIDFATIKDLTADEFIFRLGVAGELYIDRLAVTSANIVAAVLGDLVLKGEDGGYYRLHVQADGTISTERIELTDGEIESGTTSGGQTIIETVANIRDLNAQTIKAASAIITEIFADALTAGKITAGQAMIASATIPELSATVIKAIGDSLDLSANSTIQLLIRHDDELRAWLTFSEVGLRIGKAGSTYSTLTDDTGFHVEQLGEKIGSFAKRELRTEAVRVGKVNTTEPRIVMREAPDGGIMFTIEEVSEQ